MLHLLTHAMILMIGDVLMLQNFGGQQLDAIVVTLYKFKLARGLAVFILSLITPRA